MEEGSDDRPSKRQAGDGKSDRLMAEAEERPVLRSLLPEGEPEGCRSVGVLGP